MLGRRNMRCHVHGIHFYFSSLSLSFSFSHKHKVEQSNCVREAISYSHKLMKNISEKIHQSHKNDHWSWAILCSQFFKKKQFLLNSFQRPIDYQIIQIFLKYCQEKLEFVAVFIWSKIRPAIVKMKQIQTWMSCCHLLYKPQFWSLFKINNNCSSPSYFLFFKREVCKNANNSKT